MEEILDVPVPYERFFNNLIEILPRLGVALAIVIFFAYLGWRFSHWVTRGFRGGKLSLNRILIQRTIFLGMLVVGLVLVLPIFGYTRIAAFFLAAGSLFALIFGIAFREIGQNILAGFLLAINRPFEIGDLVEVGNYEGHVISLHLRATHLRSYNGQDIFVPNNDFMENPLINYTRDGLRRFSFDLGLNYSHDAQKAVDRIEATLATIDEVLDSPSPSAVVHEMGTSAVILRVYYWIDMFVLDPSLFQIRSNVINRTKNALLEAGFDLPSDIVELQNADPDVPFRVRSETETPPD